MSVNISSKSPYPLPINRTEPIEGQKPFTVEANADNLKKFIQTKNPFLYQFSEPCTIDDPGYYSCFGSKSPRNIYSIVEYAIKLNDVESLKYLLDLPGCTDHFSIVDVFFYIECLKEEEVPNLDVLELLLDYVPDINAKVLEHVPVVSVWEKINGTLLDYAVRHMSHFSRLHTDVIEVLFQRGAKVSNVRKMTPFELLKRGHVSPLDEPLLQILIANEQYSSRSSSDFFLQMAERIEVDDVGDLTLARLHKYLKLEKKYDPQLSSFLTRDEFKDLGRWHEIKNAFRCVQVCSRVFNTVKEASSELERWLFVHVHPCMIETGKWVSSVKSEGSSEKSATSDEEGRSSYSHPYMIETVERVGSVKSKGSSEKSVWIDEEDRFPYSGSVKVKVKVPFGLFSSSSGEESIEYSSEEDSEIGAGLKKNKIPYGLFASSSEEESIDSCSSEETSQWLLFDEKSVWDDPLIVSLHLFHEKVTKYAKFYDTLVGKGAFENCFTKREVDVILETMAKMMENFPLDRQSFPQDRSEHYSTCWEKIHSTIQVFCGKV